MNKIRTFLGCIAASAAVSCGGNQPVSHGEVARVRDFIRTSWDASVQYNPVDSQTLIGLPRPYTVPSVSQTFQELYYWDTYFTHESFVGEIGIPIIDLSGALLLGYLFHQRRTRA